MSQKLHLTSISKNHSTELFLLSVKHQQKFQHTFPEYFDFNFNFKTEKKTRIKIEFLSLTLFFLHKICRCYSAYWKLVIKYFIDAKPFFPNLFVFVYTIFFFCVFYLSNIKSISKCEKIIMWFFFLLSMLFLLCSVVFCVKLICKIYG